MVEEVAGRRVQRVIACLRIAANMAPIDVLAPGGHAGGRVHKLLTRQHRRRPYRGSMLNCTPWGVPLVEGAGTQNLNPLSALNSSGFRV